jgi:hypothetical protein
VWDADGHQVIDLQCNYTDHSRASAIGHSRGPSSRHPGPAALVHNAGATLRGALGDAPADEPFDTIAAMSDAARTLA